MKWIKSAFLGFLLLTISFPLLSDSGCQNCIIYREWTDLHYKMDATGVCTLNGQFCGTEWLCDMGWDICSEAVCLWLINPNCDWSPYPDPYK
jgi:hypothetical protein